jgi:ribosome-associated protein
MPIVVTQRISIPEDDVEFSAIRASGPGGQHVNKTESALRLRFDALGSGALDAETKARLRAIAGRRMTAAGEIVFVAQRFRSREANRQDALARLIELIAEAARPVAQRRATKPPRSAARALRRAKTRRGDIKRLRARMKSDQD